MDMTPIDFSSQIESAGWEPSADRPDEGTLHVRFRSGGLYEYLHVSETWWRAFTKAVRPAILFEQIKGNPDWHPYRRLPSVDAHTEKTA